MARKSSLPLVFFALLALLGLVLAPSSASADEALTGIVATGGGQVRVRPDSVRILIGVEARADTVEGVQRQVSEKMTRVLAGLRALSIPNLQMRTSLVTVQPVHATTREGVRTARIVGFSAATGISVAVRNAPFDAIAGLASAILTTALQTGANITGDFELFLDDPSTARAQALAEAVQDARRNAEIMAKAAGVAITGVALVSEAAMGVPMLAMQAPQYGAPSMPAMPVEPGEIVVSSNVTVRFTTR